MASRRHRTRRHRTRRVNRHRHNKSCRHSSVSLEKINGKCYKNGRKFPCSKFVKEERNVVKNMNINNFWDIFKM